MRNNNFNNYPPDNNDRTRAFDVSKKPKRNDSIFGTIGAVCLFVITLISVARITVVGQFLDDVIFTLPFGWFKYFVYLILFLVYILMYVGLKFKFKKRFLLMVFVTWCNLCWIISACLLIVGNYTESSGLYNIGTFKETIFMDVMKQYWNQWKDYSVFNSELQGQNWLISDPITYFTPWAGGGLIGSLLTGISAYTTIYGSLVFSVIGLVFTTVFILTGNPLYIFQPKSKRKYNRLRVLSLSGNSKKNNNDIYNKKQNIKKNSIFQLIHSSGDDEFVNEQIIQSMRESDFTIEMPSFKRENTIDLYVKSYSDDLYSDNFSNPYENNFQQQNNQFNNNYPNNNYPNNNYQNDIYSESHYEVLQEKPAFVEPISPGEIIKPRRKNIIIDETIPEGKYGEVLPEAARVEFAKETAVTPFGANGKTREIISNHGSSINEIRTENKKNTSGQMSLDDFINSDDIVEKNDYRSPMSNKVSRNNFDWTSDDLSPTLQVNTSKKINKTWFVNENYILPNMNILEDRNPSLQEMQEIEAKANLQSQAIDQVFENFKVKAKVIGRQIGPTVTKFEIQPEPGTKVNAVINLEDDLKMALTTSSIRLEYPIPGKNAIGIEVPNKVQQPVSLKSVLSKIPMNKIASKLLFGLGKTVSGEILHGELNTMPHLLVAGSTGSGKSVMINGIIASILMRAKPHEVKFLMIDPKQVELSIYSKIPHLLAPVISDMTLAANALSRVISEMERRYALFTDSNVKKIDEYNKLKSKEAEKLPYYIIVIDELADLMLTANKKDVEDSIMRLTQMARAAGIHLIVATQRPSTDVLTGVIKSNIPSRIAFAVASYIDSRTILDSAGAEKLIGKGDLLYMKPGDNTLTRAQGAFVSDDEIKKIVDFCANQQNQIFEEEFTKIDDNSSAGSNGKHGGSNDSMYEQIKEYVIEIQKASTSLIQRRFSIGYNRAANIIDDLETEGVIGPQNGSKPREVFIKNY